MYFERFPMVKWLSSIEKYFPICCGGKEYIKNLKTYIKYAAKVVLRYQLREEKTLIYRLR
jgi:hypothetical protein